MPLEPEELLIDPEDSALAEGLFETLKKDGLFASGVRLLSEWMVGRPGRPYRALLPACMETPPPGE